MSAKPTTSIERGAGGFALVAALLVLVLLAGIALAMFSLATIELRHADAENHQRHARANARLALIQAIGQLQMAMGPDTRASGSSGLVTAGGQRHWTGVWKTRAPDGRPWIVREPDTGGLTDRRLTDGYQPEREVLQWLVSGQSRPDETGSDRVQLVGPGSVADPDSMGVKVPSIEILTSGRRGKLAWWTGDLGQRANLAAHAAPELIGNGPPRKPETEERLVSEATVSLSGAGREWAKLHFHDFTVHSRSLLSNVREGGLKQDLSVYFESAGTIAPSVDRPGLTDTDRLAGPASEGEANAAGLSWERNPFRRAAPRFGILRHWAGIAAPLHGSPLEAIQPETNTREANGTPANLRSVRLDGTVKSSVQPILVEASQCHSFSWFKKPGPDPNPYHLRKHLYPKVVLWNPYPIALSTPPMMVLLQVNGRHDFWIDGYFPAAKGKTGFAVHSPWATFDGGRSRDFVPADGSIFSSPGFKDPHMGSYYYQLAPTRFGPGECLVFTPAVGGVYRNGIREDGGAYNLVENLLTPDQPPHPERCLTISNPPGQPGFGFIPTGIGMESTAPYYALFGMQGLRDPADDFRVILKDLADETQVDVDSFDRLPQISFVSASLQYGAGTEPVSPWPGSLKTSIEETTAEPPKMPPDGRTRQGLRLRSGGASPASRTEALFANWNPRAAYSLRSSRERFHAAEGRPGIKGGPWGFGIYEKLVPTAGSDWNDGFPVEKGGRYHTSPLGDVKNDAATVMFDLPREGTGVVSMGGLQHVVLSNLVWHPSRVIGNSLADPRVGLSVTLPARMPNRGFISDHIGSPTGGPPDAWAASARSILRGLPQDGEELTYDLSFEANHALWDRYFVSGADEARKSIFAADPLGHPLPNPRLEVSGVGKPDETAAGLKDFHQAAFHLTLKGAFNVNSLSVDAWASVLASSRQVTPDGAATAFPRIQGGEARLLNDGEIRRLASAIVAEVKLRGPFLDLSDFVNRRLAPGGTGRCGALEAAIRSAGLNSEITALAPLLDDASTHSHPPEIPDPLPVDPALKPESTAWGREKFLTQADILQALGDSLVTRSDTFVIRAYGESADHSGDPRANAWCEAMVQRVAETVKPCLPANHPREEAGKSDFGRQFRLVRFRWLTRSEI